MRQIRPGAERRLVEIVERGQPEGEEFAKHHTLGEAFGRPEAEPQAEPIKSLADHLLVARSQQRKPIAHDNPVGQAAVDDAALPSGIANHFGVMPHIGNLERGRIDGPEHVEIQETVIERSDQRIRHRVREPHQIRVVAGRIDHNKVASVLDFVDRGREVCELDCLVLVDPCALAACDCVMLRHFQRDAGAFGGVAAVLDVMREGLLPAVEVDGCDALTGLEQRHRDMHRGGGLARAALLVAEHNHMRGTRYATCCLKQHTQPLKANNLKSNFVKVKADCTRS